MDDSKNIAIDDILAAFRTSDGTYRREMVEAALRRPEEIIPRLVAVLEEILADPEGFLEQEDRFDHIYAFMLLGHFKSKSAHAAITQVFSLKSKQVDDLFGNHINESLPVVLLRTCSGDLRHIRIMALDRSLDTYCRLAAVQAMTYAAADGLTPREQVMTFIAGLLTNAPQEEDIVFLSFASVSLLNLYPEEHMALVEKAYQDEIIDPSIVTLEDFEEALALGKEQTLARLRQELKRYDLEDLHATMSGWSCFSADEDWAAAAGPGDLIDSGFYGRPQGQTLKKNAKPLQQRRRKKTEVPERKNSN